MLKLVVDRGRCGSVDTAARSAVTASAGNDLGSASGCLGLPIIGIGLAGISSAVTGRCTTHSRSTRQRRIEAAAL
jgi:hypothetical protein